MTRFLILPLIILRIESANAIFKDRMTAIGFYYGQTESNPEVKNQGTSYTFEGSQVMTLGLSMEWKFLFSGIFYHQRVIQSSERIVKTENLKDPLLLNIWTPRIFTAGLGFYMGSGAGKIEILNKSTNLSHNWGYKSVGINRFEFGFMGRVGLHWRMGKVFWLTGDFWYSQTFTQGSRISQEETDLNYQDHYYMVGIRYKIR